MRHLKNKRKLNRTSSHRLMLFRNMSASLLLNEKLKTTTAKAKELRSVIEKLITLAKKGSLHSKRKAAQIINNKKILYKLFSIFPKRFEQRKGGYTRVLKNGFRSGDNAPLSIIEFLHN
jgi:large subunit ribosomal protein L17